MQVWYTRFGHINNVKIIYVLKLLIKIRDFSINYNLAKIYSSFKIFKVENLTNNNINLLFKL